MMISPFVFSIFRSRSGRARICIFFFFFLGGWEVWRGRGDEDALARGIIDGAGI